MNPQQNPIAAIAAERAHQIWDLGYTLDHDKSVNNKGQLLQAANAIIASDGWLWPDSWGRSLFSKIMKKPIEERYIIAGALKKAESERLRSILDELEEEVKEIAAQIKAGFPEK